MATYPYFVLPSNEVLHDFEFISGDLPIPNYHYFPDYALDSFFELEVQPVVSPPIPRMPSPIIRPISPIPHPDNPVIHQSMFDLVTDYILLGIF